MGGPEMAPHTPQRSERPGKPGALLYLAATAAPLDDARRRGVRPSSRQSERADALGQRLGLLEVRKVSGPGDRLEPGARDGVSVRRPVVVGGDEAIVGAPQEQG